MTESKRTLTLNNPLQPDVKSSGDLFIDSVMNGQLEDGDLKKRISEALEGVPKDYLKNILNQQIVNKDEKSQKLQNIGEALKNADKEIFAAIDAIYEINNNNQSLETLKNNLVILQAKLLARKFKEISDREEKKKDADKFKKISESFNTLADALSKKIETVNRVLDNDLDGIKANHSGGYLRKYNKYLAKYIESKKKF